MMISIYSLDFFQSIFLIDLPDENKLTGIFIGLFFVFLIYALIKASSRSIKVVHSHWHHMFDTRPFTPLEFYESFKKKIDEKEIENISFASVTHSERGMLSAKRIYLRVTYREYMMDICAAPFAKQDFFVSWWLGDAGFTFRDLLISIPVIGKLVSRREKTFYELDTEIMFKETVAKCVKETIEGLTETKGTRLTDMSDWKGTAMQFNKH
jgi:hypothetical protein